MNPVISIIVPCYRVERYLDRCVQSLLHQTLKDIEIILVDDGSPDRCSQMCDAYARQDARIKVVHKENGGLGYARNSGLEIATGDYVAFVDSDDFVETDMYEVLYEEAVQSDADVVFSNFYTERKKGQWHENREVNERKEWTGIDIKEFMLDMVASAPYEKTERKYQMSVWHSIYRRSIVESNHIRFFSEREVLSEDFPFQMEFLKHAQKVVYIPRVFYHYCSNGDSLTHSFSPDKFQRIQKLYNIMSEQLKDVNDSQERLDRFYIGYMRARMIELIESELPEKRKILSDVLKSNTLKSIYNRYSPSYLPLYSRLIYIFSAKKQTILLMLFSKCVISFKRVILFLHNLSPYVKKYGLS